MFDQQQQHYFVAPDDSKNETTEFFETSEYAEKSLCDKHYSASQMAAIHCLVPGRQQVHHGTLSGPMKVVRVAQSVVFAARHQQTGKEAPHQPK